MTRMTNLFERHRVQILSGVVGLVAGAVIVGGIWGVSAAVRGPETVAAPAPSSSATTDPGRAPSASRTPQLGTLGDDGGSDKAGSGGSGTSGGTANGSGGTATAAPAAACTSPTIRVSTADALKSALEDAKAGDVIALANGTYDGTFEGTATGTASQPIALCGGSGAVLDGGDPSDGYVMHLDGGAYWTLSGFTVQNGQKGVMLDDTQHSVLQGLTVRKIGDEAMHVRANSSDNTVRGNHVSETGLRKPKFGEGIYIGSSKNNWCDVSDCKPDRSDRNVVTENTITDTAAENVDIKEGTTGGVLSDNSFDGAGMQGQNHADSWVDVKGNGWSVTGNRGVHSILDGFQTHELLDGWGTDNTFSGNTVDLGNSDGVAFAFRPVLGNTVSCDNDVVGSNEFSTTKCTS